MADPNPLFGKIFVPQVLEQAAKATLIEWFPTHLKEVESQLSIKVGSTTVPKESNYKNRNKFDALTINDIPLVTIISPGIVGTPQKDGRGKYKATWRLGIGVATAAETEEQAKLLGDMYGAVVRDIMLKRGGQVGGRVRWLDEQYVDLPIADQLHQYRAAALYFSVDIENVVTGRGGPTVPDAEPYIVHTAETVDITLVKES